MGTLFTFGCSYTQNYKDNKIKSYDEYYKFKGNSFPPVWGEILSDKLNFNLKNYGVGGGGNDVIFRNFCNHINEIEKDDIVIIQWSYVHRYQWVNYKRDSWENFGAGWLGISNCISENTHEEISYNRTHSLYVDQVYEWMKMIDRISNLVGFKVYYWSGCARLLYPLDNEEKQNRKYLLGNLTIPQYETIFYEVFKLGGKTIKVETNNLIDDLHFGESAHKIMGELFYNHITNHS
jgi:hypothetical protein